MLLLSKFIVREMINQRRAKLYQYLFLIHDFDTRKSGGIESVSLKRDEHEQINRAYMHWWSS